MPIANGLAVIICPLFVAVENHLLIVQSPQNDKSIPKPIHTLSESSWKNMVLVTLEVLHDEVTQS
jgi:hypothetical protein